MSPQGRTIHCNNPKSLIKEFHQTCLHLSDSVTNVWYNPNLRLLAEFQSKKPRKASRASSIKCTHNDQALKLDSICVCGLSLKVNERLLECHSENCQSGKFFFIQCLDYKRMPYNSQTTWVCSNCKVSLHLTFPECAHIWLRKKYKVVIIIVVNFVQPEHVC